jgi:alpha-N-arabinofuranosidase
MMKKGLAALVLLSSSSLCTEIFAQALAPNPFKARSEPNAEVTYHNPVIPGFYSDPSVARVGEDYYLVTSTFEYFPGIPVFHSRDLVNWEQIGHAIHRPDQLPQGLNIFACTIRHHDGTFYVMTTNTGRGGNFFVTATNPAGPWSDPVWVDVGGIDPDLFFDDDGKVYTIGSTFTLYEIDPRSGQLLSEGRKVWASTGGRYAEGPHIYKKDGWYYLMAAEGGTEEAHSETIARSNDIWGPYYSYPANPILAHANAAGQQNPIQGVGHADMVQAHDGSWWMVFHGYRTVIRGGFHHTLGRETCLAPVSWPKNGWPQVNGNGTVTVDMTTPTLPLQPFPQALSRVSFDQELGLEWNYVQSLELDRYSLDARPGFLRLRGSASELGAGEASPTFVGRRLQHMDFTSTTRLDFEPASENEEAGMVLLNNGTHFDLSIKRSNGNRVLTARLQFGSVSYESDEVVLASGPVNLRIEGAGSAFRFSYAQGDNEYREIQEVSARYLSSETIGGFTGTYVGLYATGHGRPSVANADYDWLEYVVNSSPQPTGDGDR